MLPCHLCWSKSNLCRSKISCSLKKRNKCRREESIFIPPVLSDFSDEDNTSISPNIAYADSNSCEADYETINIF